MVDSKCVDVNQNSRHIHEERWHQLQWPVTRGNYYREDRGAGKRGVAKKTAQTQIKGSSKLIFISRVEVVEGGRRRWILTLVLYAKNTNM